MAATEVAQTGALVHPERRQAIGSVQREVLFISKDGLAPMKGLAKQLRSAPCQSGILVALDEESSDFQTPVDHLRRRLQQLLHAAQREDGSVEVA